MRRARQPASPVDARRPPPTLAAAAVQRGRRRVARPADRAALGGPPGPRRDRRPDGDAPRPDGDPVEDPGRRRGARGSGLRGPAGRRRVPDQAGPAGRKRRLTSRRTTPARQPDDEPARGRDSGAAAGGRAHASTQAERADSGRRGRRRVRRHRPALARRRAAARRPAARAQAPPRLRRSSSRDLVRRGIFVRPPIDAWVGSWRSLGFTGAHVQGRQQPLPAGNGQHDWTSRCRCPAADARRLDRATGRRAGGTVGSCPKPL